MQTAKPVAKGQKQKGKSGRRSNVPRAPKNGTSPQRPAPKNRPKKTQNQMQVLKSGMMSTLNAMVLSDQVKLSHVKAATNQLVGPATIPDPFRWTTGGVQTNLQKTHVASLPMRHAFNLSSLLGANPSGAPAVERGGSVGPVWAFQQTCAQFILTDDPMVPLIAPVKAPGSVITYLLNSWRCADQDATGLIRLYHSEIAGSLISSNVCIGGDGFSNPGGVLGDLHPFGCSSDGFYYFWVDANTIAYAQITVNFTAFYSSATPGSVVLQMQQMQLLGGKPRWVTTSTSTAATPVNGTMFTTSAFVSSSGYFRMLLTINSTPAGSDAYVTIQPGSVSYAFQTSVASRHWTVDALLATGSSFKQGRVLGTSLLLTNTTPLMFEGGRSVGFSASNAEEYWFDLTGEPDRFNNFSDQFVKIESWKKGIYGYVKPREIGKFTPLVRDCGSLTSMNGDFANPSGFSIFNVYPSDSPTADITLMAQLHMNLELRTENPVYNLKAAQMTAAAFDLFVQAVQRSPAPFSCNIGHIAMIIAAIKSALQFAGSVLAPGVDLIAKKGPKLVEALNSDTPISGLFGMVGL